MPFLETYRQNVRSWNLIIRAYAQNGQAREAVKVFKLMQEEGIMPNKITFISILSVCNNILAFAEGSQIHAYIVESGLQNDVVVGTALMSMYAKCGSLADAQKIFDKVHERNVIIWTAIISAHAQHGQVMQGLQLFDQMHGEGFLPNNVTFVTILDMCATLPSLNECKRMHIRIIGNGFEPDVVLATALVHLYGKCGSVESAWTVFEKMPHWNLISWSVMLGAYAQQGHGKEALQLFDRMHWEGVIPDRVVLVSILDSCVGLANLGKAKQLHASIVGCGLGSHVGLGAALVNMYGRCSSLVDAQETFNEMSERDVVLWNTLIALYSQHGKGKEAIKIFNEMQNQVIMPNIATFVSILDACANQAALWEGKLKHTCIVGSGCDSDVAVATAVVDMYSKCGRIEYARRIFDSMLKRDAILWTAMIAGYAQHGEGRKALQLFDAMQQEGLQPDNITFGIILSACSHAGLVEEGHGLFLSMDKAHGIEPSVDHYSCVIDLLGRAGRLDEAERLVKELPLKPNVVLWMTLLSACRNQVDVERGERAASRVFELDPDNCASYVVLLSLYAAAGKGHAVASVMKIMRDKGLKKQAGLSSIEIKGSVHGFAADDQSHPQKDKIYAELQKLNSQMKEAGYVADTNLVLYGSNKVKEMKLTNHSERLAIVFGLINTPRGTPLLITKNLRVCSDCHTATKFISKISHREIVVRDAKRFHHIKDGICSCADYW